MTRRELPLLCCLLTLVGGCSIRSYAINMVGDALASGNSVYESEEDLELAGAALPFGLKLMESLLAEAPDHEGLLLTSCRGFVLYSYAYVDFEAEQALDEDLDRARALRLRARRLYLRGFDYGLRGLERAYPGLGLGLERDATAAVAAIDDEDDLPLLYWTAAALGLAISASRNDAAMLARLPAVDAMLDRALAVDETWNDGALHEFKVVLASAQPSGPNFEVIRRHYDRALELSGGMSAGLYLAYAEAVAVPMQDGALFRTLLDRALAVDPDAQPENRLVTLLAHRRARWLAQRVDDLILDLPAETAGDS